MSFAIIAAPRTGSTHVTNLLHAQSDIFCNGEICHAKKVFVRWKKADRGESVLSELTSLRERDPRGFLDRVLAMNYGRKEVGFKILKGQSRQVFDAIFSDAGIKKVVLFRRNVLANYSSKLIASQSGKYALRKNDLKSVDVSRPPISFDANDFARFCKKYNHYYDGVMSTLRNSGQYYHVINYEDINDPEFFGNLLRFLGSEDIERASKGRNVKQNPAYILSRFSNADTVEDFLRRHNLLHWAYEGELSLGPLQAAADKEAEGKRALRKKRRSAAGKSVP